MRVPGHRVSFRDFAVFNMRLPGSSLVLNLSSKWQREWKITREVFLGQAWLWSASPLPVFSWPDLSYVVPSKYRGARKMDRQLFPSNTTILFHGRKQKSLVGIFISNILTWIVYLLCHKPWNYICGLWYHQYACESNEFVEHGHKACSDYLLYRKDRYPLCKLLDETCLGIVSRTTLHNDVFYLIKRVFNLTVIQNSFLYPPEFKQDPAPVSDTYQFEGS